MGHCNVCDTDVPDGQLVDHLAREHDLTSYQRWPDGDVVVDESEALDPEDFLP